MMNSLSIPIGSIADLHAHVHDLRVVKAYPNFDFSSIFALPIVLSIEDKVHVLTQQ